MTWSYSPSDIATSVRDQVRFLIGDVNEADELLQDEEIDFILTQTSGAYYAAARCCQAIAAGFGREVSVKVGHLALANEKKYEHYLELADTLRAQASIGNASPVMVADSVNAKRAAELDPDRVQPAFRRDLGSNPLVSSVDPSLSLANTGVPY
jgi:hypothetical protein